MSKIPTAQEYIDNIDQGNFDKNDLIEFAKLHVEAALKAASEKAKTELAYGFERVNKDSILNAYSLENIK